MRIIHLADYGGPYPGSFIPMVRAVKETAGERGWSFEAVFSDVAKSRAWYAQLRADEVAARVAPPWNRRALGAWLTEMLAEQSGRTVLHTHFTRFDLPAVAAARGRADTNVVWHLHTRLEQGPRATLRNTLKFGLAGRRTTAMLCVSADLRDAVRLRLAPARRLVVFPNAIDLERFRPATQDERTQARSELGVSPQRPLLVHFGWDWETKGGELFLEAVAALSRDGVEVTAMCVGGGPPARSTGERLGLGERVAVTAARDDVRTFYAAADVFVSSSLEEGAMPFAALEALSTGTPVVGSAIPNHVLLAQRTHGCVLAERTPTAFADAIASTLRARSEDKLEVDVGGLAESLDLRAWARRLLDLYADTSRD